MGVGTVKTPRTWHVVSDVIMDFIRLNDLDDVMDQKFKDISQVRREYPNLVQLFKNSPFPPELVEGPSRALDYFGDVPLIIRSSSLSRTASVPRFPASTRACSCPTADRAPIAWQRCRTRSPRSGLRSWARTRSNTGASGACRNSSRRWAS